MDEGGGGSISLRPASPSTPLATEDGLPGGAPTTTAGRSIGGADDAAQRDEGEDGEDLGSDADDEDEDEEDGDDGGSVGGSGGRRSKREVAAAVVQTPLGVSSLINTHCQFTVCTTSCLLPEFKSLPYRGA